MLHIMDYELYDIYFINNITLCNRSNSDETCRIQSFENILNFILSEILTFILREW